MNALSKLTRSDGNLQEFPVGQHTLIRGDCLSGLAQISPNSVDVVVTSPPYNIGIEYESYTDDLLDNSYVEWISDVGSAIKVVLKDQGSFFLNISGSGTKPWLPFRLATELGRQFRLQNHISWVKSVSIDVSTNGHFKPISSGRFLNNNHEHIFHFTKTGNVVIDRLAVGMPFTDKTNVSRWGHKRDLRCRGNTWFIPYKTIRSKSQKFYHPATFPVELPLWCIFLHGVSGSTVLDPFSGTGSTIIAAHFARAKGIGIDLDERYTKVAKDRIATLVGTTLNINLDATEMAELLKQDPATAKDGGFQSLLVALQNKLNRSTGELTLTEEEFKRIAKYAFDYRQGGWENSLQAIFSRNLGPKLGR